MSELVADGLSVVARGAAVLDAVSLRLSGGEFIGLIGPNGAGKTTLIRALSGHVRPSAGTVLADGRPILDFTARERALRISYLPQTREVAWNITAESVVALGRFAYGAPERLGAADRAAVDAALAACGADPFRNRTIFTLSGGEQARVHLARAFAAQTPILLADEPTAALDPRHARDIMRALRIKAEAGALVVAALHDLALAQRHCTRLIALEAGRIAADGPADAVLDRDLLARLFGIDSIDP